jgi:predicted nucleic acid-binding protein
MATECWVANASPLILLGKIDNLDLLAALADSIVVPQLVVNGVGAKPDGKLILATLAQHPRCAIVQDEAVPPELIAWDLGAGETQVIASARRHGANRVILDDREARRCARVMNLMMGCLIGRQGEI